MFAFAAIVGWVFGQGVRGEESSDAAWGIDACLTCYVGPENVAAGIEMLRQSGVRWVRERGVWIKDPALAAVGGDETVNRLRALKAAGFKIVAFAGGAVPVERPENQLPENLLAVYAAAFRQGRDCAGLVDAWELSGEPDVGYCRDLPDRLAAQSKAMYLGLHDGAASVGRSTIVLNGALALPAGPWLERAAANGLLDYTDAYNFHYYGNPNELASHIRAHRLASREMQALARPMPVRTLARPSDRGAGAVKSGVPAPRFLPMWITECGVNATVPGDFLNAQRRAFQAEFTRTTAEQARAAREVAVFMPFIFVNRGDPHALVQAETMAPLPAWNLYSQLSRELVWPNRRLVAENNDRAGRVVLQWLPAAGTRSHKVAGTYRVLNGGTLQGEFRIYNFNDHPVTGELTAEALTEVKLIGAVRMENGGRQEGRSSAGRVTIPAGGSVVVPVSYSPRAASGYFREWETARFLVDSHQVSQVRFGLERRPELEDFKISPVELLSLSGNSRLQPPVVNHETTLESCGAPWRVFNGLSASSFKFVSIDTKRAPTTRFSVTHPVNDPLAPTYAMAALSGAPKNARFLHVRLDRPLSVAARVRVDLVDEDAQRFTIWENLGVPYDESPWDLWLALSDFHPYLWSAVKLGNRRLRPERIKEIGLRVYLPQGGSLDVELEWALGQ